MRRGLVVVVAFVFAPAAQAAPPAVSARAEAVAPLTVRLTATGDAASYRWDLGDGTTSDGPVVEHAYAEPGVYTVVLTAFSTEGDTLQASLSATAYRIAFDAPARATYGRRSRFTGSIWPAVPRAPVSVVGADGRVLKRAWTRPNGGFAVRLRLRGRGPFHAVVAGLRSKPDAVVLRPMIEASLRGSGVVGAPLRLLTRVRPRDAGTLAVTVWRNGRRTYAGAAASLRLSTRGPASYRVRLELRPAEGYARAVRTVRTAVLQPRLAPGSRGVSVRALEERLRELHYALPRVDGLYGLDTYQAILTFQKVTGLPRTGRVDPRTWSALVRALPPRARYPGTHIEISKGRQVLFVVRDGHVAAAVHVSTGATGNTPVGRWRIYRKVRGWDWVLWYPMYFLRGFAIHGYPSVPAYPASHGCVRVPMWIAAHLFSMHGYGQTVYIYW